MWPDADSLLVRVTRRMQNVSARVMPGSGSGLCCCVFLLSWMMISVVFAVLRIKLSSESQVLILISAARVLTTEAGIMR